MTRQLAAMPTDFLAPLFRLDGRTVLVCGAARGLGWEIARLLGRAGAFVVIAGRDQAQLAPRLAELAADGSTASCVAFDMEKNRCYRRELGYFSQYGDVTPPRKTLPVVRQ